MSDTMTTTAITFALDMSAAEMRAKPIMEAIKATHPNATWDATESEDGATLIRDGKPYAKFCLKMRADPENPVLIRGSIDRIEFLQDS